MTLPCSFNTSTKEVFNYSGQKIKNCTECDCETKSFEMVSGVIGGNLNFRVINLGFDFRLEWNCPGCGAATHENCTPLDAISLSETIKNDAFCFSCRKKH